MLPYMVFLITIHLLVYRLANLGVLISVAAGFALGTAGLVAFYLHFGVWRQFAEIVLPFTLAGHGEAHSLKYMLFGDSSAPKTC